MATSRLVTRTPPPAITATSEEFYNSVAGLYRVYSSTRRKYLEAVDNMVIALAGRRSRFLDVGAGDGGRSLHIADRVGATQVVLLDSSPNMLDRGPAPPHVRKIVCPIADYTTEERFDLITCLWNVFGHIPTTRGRLKAVRRISELLSSDGIFCMDINNRYNFRQYGVLAVVRNVWKDLLRLSGRGSFPLTLGNTTGWVYIHSPCEFDHVARRAGFAIECKAFLDYRDGSRRTGFGGQVFYAFRKQAG
jgi:SAM-dependent methyltransferase